jgi:hypothetical protein
MDTDWGNCGWQDLLPVLAEHATAERLWRPDHETVWLGGGNPGWDVCGRLGRANAKRAWRHRDRICFAAPKAGFDPTVVDLVTAVLLGKDDDYEIGYSTGANGDGRLTARYQRPTILLLPVARLNPLLAYEARGRSSISLADAERIEIPEI